MLKSQRLLLRKFKPVRNSHRCNSNFLLTGGFTERTAKADFANKELLILDEKNSLTYGQLNEQIGRYAALLNGKYKLGKGDRLLSRTSKTADTVALYLATLRLGAIYIPLNPAYTTKETEHFIKDAEPKVFVSLSADQDAHFSNQVSSIVDENRLAQEAKATQPQLEVEKVNGDDVATILYTSGTTGLPKGAMITHGSLAFNAEAMTDFWRFTKDDVQFHQLPFYHVHGMLISFGCTLASKSSLVFRPKFDVDDAIKWLPKSTVMMGVPTYYSRLLHSEKFTRDVVKNMRVFLAGSAPLGPVLFEEFRQRTGQTILERYGMTESAGIITSNPYEEEKRVAGSVGIPVPGTKVRISKDSVIEVKGPGIFKGYWKLPEKTKQEFTSDGYFITGDLGDMDASGTVRLLGRGKDLIITGGLNVYPAEVEDVVHASDLVKEVAIIGVPHEDFGEAVVAVCIPSSSGTKLSDEEYQQAVVEEAKEKLAGYKRPKKVIRVEDFPRNFIGKVKKNELRDIYKKLFSM